MDHKDLLGGGVLHRLDPLEQVAPVRVGGQALEVVDGGVHRDLLPEQADLFGPVQEVAAQGPLPW